MRRILTGMEPAEPPFMVDDFLLLFSFSRCFGNVITRDPEICGGFAFPRNGTFCFEGVHFLFFTTRCTLFYFNRLRVEKYVFTLEI